MRVIAGSAKRLLLKTLDGLDTRPTTDRIKETLFNITGLKRLEGKNYKFDIVFMDPPYNHEYERLVLDYLNHSPMVTEETLIVIEASRETEFGWLEESGWHMIKSKEYKTNKHVFVGRGE